MHTLRKPVQIDKKAHFIPSFWSNNLIWHVMEKTFLFHPSVLVPSC
jgi:hypothetical protein